MKEQLSEMNNLSSFDLNKVKGTYFFSLLHDKNEAWYSDIFAHYHKSGSRALLEFASAHVYQFRNFRASKSFVKKQLEALTSNGTDIEKYFALYICLLYTSPSPRDQRGSRMPSSA